MPELLSPLVHAVTAPMKMVVNLCTWCEISLDAIPGQYTPPDPDAPHRRMHPGCLGAKRHGRIMDAAREKFPEDFTPSGELRLAV